RVWIPKQRTSFLAHPPRNGREICHPRLLVMNQYLYSILQKHQKSRPSFSTTLLSFLYIREKRAILAPFCFKCDNKLWSYHKPPCHQKREFLLTMKTTPSNPQIIPKPDSPNVVPSNPSESRLGKRSPNMVSRFVQNIDR
ncbi:hypothetical protein B0I26_1411, partial [Anoxybacillus vitaminiphilus]